MGDNLKGVNVPSMIVPTNTDDTYPTHEDTYGKGGYRSVDTLDEMYAIPRERLKVGCRIHINQLNKDYVIDSIDPTTGNITVIDGSVSQVIDKILVSPVMSGQWEIYNSSQIVVDIKTDKNLVLEHGYLTRLLGKFMWTHVNGMKDPTRCSGDLGQILPESGVESQVTTLSIVSTNQTYRESIFAPKEGLMVSGTSVIAATGDDEKSDSMSVSFRYRIYNGVSSAGSPSESTVKALSSGLYSSRSRTINNVTAGSSEYYVYAYPKSLGALTSIVQNGAAPVLGDFNRTEVNITSVSGTVIPYYVYTSINRGAFQNVTLAFN